MRPHEQLPPPPGPTRLPRWLATLPTANPKGHHVDAVGVDFAEGVSATNNGVAGPHRRVTSERREPEQLAPPCERGQRQQRRRLK